MATNNNEIESRLWAAADQLWANSDLRPSEYSTPVLGLIFLRYADLKFTQAKEEIEAQGLTPKEFATRQLKLARPGPRFEAMLHKPSIRMRWIDPIAEYLGKIPSQLLIDGLAVGEGTFPPCRDTIKESVMKAFEDEGLTLRQVAKSMGITAQYLSKDLCTGNPGLDRIEQIANVVEIEPWKLILPVGTTVNIDKTGREHDDKKV